MDVLTSFYTPAGMFHTGYQPKTQAIELVREVQRYYTQGRVTLALEYLTPIKGINCSLICSELGSGRISARKLQRLMMRTAGKWRCRLGFGSSRLKAENIPLAQNCCFCREVRRDVF